MIVKKKPLIVHAWQFDSNARMKDIPHWVLDAMFADNVRSLPGKVWDIETIDGGSAQAKDGDYLIRGVFGELYPCRQDVFDETYERL